MKLVFISPCFNAKENISVLLDSISSQKDSRWESVLIDDISEDSTASEILKLSKGHKKITAIINEQKKFALRNIVETARSYQDDNDVIIATVDGDDSLCNKDTVSIILSEYEKGSDVVWTAHEWDINGMNISRDMPAHVDPYSWPWCTSHLRTFRASMLKNISDKNFQDTSGNWFKRGYDQALMLPLLHLTDKRKDVDKVCYRYNIDSSSIPADKRVWSEMEQISTINLVRARGFLK